MINNCRGRSKQVWSSETSAVAEVSLVMTSALARVSKFGHNKQNALAEMNEFGHYK